jgi:hypothetical protein
VLRSGSALLATAALAACVPEPGPRTAFDFMEDGSARDGVLTRCNRDRDATLADEECANARRAAAAIALEAERAREADLTRESEAKLLAMRDGEARRSAAEEGAETAALAAAEAAYEARWRNSNATLDANGRAAAAPAPAFGAPLGPVMPSMTDSALFDVFAEGADPLGRRTLEVEAAVAPSNEFEIPSLELALNDLAVIPRPFREDETQR